MKNLYGMTGIEVKIIEVYGNEVEELNNFLKEYNGNIIDVQTIGMFNGFVKFIIMYKATED